MKSVLDKYGQQIRENKEIDYNGLKLYPLTVRDLTLYLSAKPSFELMLSSLSPALARLSWCEALYELDKMSEGKTNFFPLALTVLAIAAKVEKYNQGKSFDISLYANNEGKLSSVVLGQNTTTNPVIFSMQQMSEIREIIAAQNGYEIPDENWNPELVRAQQYLQKNTDIKIKSDLDSLVSSVAFNTHRSIAEIYEWTIREFFLQQKAIDRTLRFLICGVAQAMGTQFKDGNPVPMWQYDREADLPTDFKTLSQLEEEAGGVLKAPKDRNGYI